MDIDIGQSMLKDMALIIHSDARFSHFECLTVNVMDETEQKEYFGTSHRRFITDGEENHCEEGEIFINLRDIMDIDMLIRVGAHEAAHLITEPEEFEEMKSMLDTFFRQEMAKKGWDTGK